MPFFYEWLRLEVIVTNQIRSVVQRIRSWFAAADQPGSKTRARQVIEMVRMAGKGQYSPGEYWVYGFYRNGVDMPDMLSFMSNQQHFQQHLPHLNDPTAIPFLQNKWFFYLHFARLGMPVPECYGVFDANFGFTADGETLRSEADLRALIERRGITNFVTKPVSGSQGRGVKLITVVGDGEVYVEGSGEPGLDLNELATVLQDTSSMGHGAGTLVQQQLAQHQALRELSPTAAANIRVITLRRPNGSAVVTSASMRIGRVGASMSNASQGGLLARVDPATGVINAVRDGMYIGSQLVENHPDTGLRLTGRTVPHWDDVLAICLNGARNLPGMASVGWDVILTDEGPKLLEGNHDWDMISEQLFGTGYLTDFCRDLLAEHGLDFSRTRLPRFRLSNLLAFLKD